MHFPHFLSSTLKYSRSPSRTSTELKLSLLGMSRIGILFISYLSVTSFKGLHKKIKNFKYLLVIAKSDGL